MSVPEDFDGDVFGWWIAGWVGIDFVLFLILLGIREWLQSNYKKLSRYSKYKDD